MPKTEYQCPNCGSAEVQKPVWMRVNDAATDIMRSVNDEFMCFDCDNEWCGLCVVVDGFCTNPHGCIHEKPKAKYEPAKSVRVCPDCGSEKLSQCMLVDVNTGLPTASDGDVTCQECRREWSESELVTK